MIFEMLAISFCTALVVLGAPVALVWLISFVHGKIWDYQWRRMMDKRMKKAMEEL